jgi:hypothetical protein
MSTIVLYLGGMAGDFLVSCFNPNQFESINVLVTLKPEFGRLKKFWQMDTDAKTDYINSFSNNAFLSSHDTEFSKLFPNRTIRVTCSNSETLLRLSNRFRALNRPEVIEHLCSQHNLYINNFDQEYAEMCSNWVSGVTFPVEFDISNVYNSQFVKDFEQFCIQHNIKYDLGCVEELHKTWLEHNENFNR